MEKALETLRAREYVTPLPRTTAFGYYNHNFVALIERLTDHEAKPASSLPRECLWQVRATEVVLATGAHERPLAFADNDRPGVMLAESVRAYLNRYGVAPGRRIVFATLPPPTGPPRMRRPLGLTSLWWTPGPKPRIRAERSLASGVPLLSGHTVLGSTGTKGLTDLIVAPVDASGRVGARRMLPCDCAGVSGGWTPSVHLFSQSRGKLAFRSDIDAFVPGQAAQGTRSARACRGVYDLGASLSDGWAARAAASGAAVEKTFTAAPPTPKGFVPARVLPTDDDPKKVRAFIDFQNDVTAKDIRLAVQRRFRKRRACEALHDERHGDRSGQSVQHGGPGPALGVLEKDVPMVGAIDLPAALYAGHLRGGRPGRQGGEIVRSHSQSAVARLGGGLFEGLKLKNVSLWRRAWYFPRAGEDRYAAVARECKAVREGVGIFDASTLGKIEVVGPDAAEFLNRIYINAWLKLEPGKCRYGLMLKEDGFVFDDGVVARLAPDRFHLTTTTGGAPRVLAHMEDYLQTEWTDLKVFVTSTTEEWAVIALQGPKARETFAPLISDVDLSGEAFPHMAIRNGHVMGVPARIFRVSFTGELGYEINVPSDYARAVWEALCEHGRAFGVTPYGTETMHVLRAERASSSLVRRPTARSPRTTSASAAWPRKRSATSSASVP